MATKITSFETACKVLGIEPNLPEVSALPKKHQNAIQAHYKLVIITQALNFDQKAKTQWEPNWNDTSEWKYWNYFWVEASKEKPSGFGFSFSYYAYSGTDADIGSRLCFRTRALADYARKQFEKLYIEYYLIG